MRRHWNIIINGGEFINTGPGIVDAAGTIKYDKVLCKIFRYNFFGILQYSTNEPNKTALLCRNCYIDEQFILEKNF